jgi:exopolyphosphatase/pppGpp-phosphohydrolase
MSHELFLFEFGSTSLKFHFRPRRGGAIQRFKVAWSIAHEIYRDGRISKDSILQASASVQAFLRFFDGKCDIGKVIAFATGAFRDAENLPELAGHLRFRLGLKLRVISAEQEAKLLKALYLGRNPALPSLAFDLGGGSLQWVRARSPDRGDEGSVPIGAIRLLHSAQDVSGKFAPDLGQHLAEGLLEKVPPAEPGQVVGTGGTLKSICKRLGVTALSLEAVEFLEEHVKVHGPPSNLKPHRRAIFLPGIILVRRLMERLGTRQVRYQSLSVGGALLEKVIPFYDADDPTAPPDPGEILNRLHYSEILRAS